MSRVPSVRPCMASRHSRYQAIASKVYAVASASSAARSSAGTSNERWCGAVELELALGWKRTVSPSSMSADVRDRRSTISVSRDVENGRSARQRIAVKAAAFARSHAGRTGCGIAVRLRAKPEIQYGNVRVSAFLRQRIDVAIAGVVGGNARSAASAFHGIGGSGNVRDLGSVDRGSQPRVVGGRSSARKLRDLGSR